MKPDARNSLVLLVFISEGHYGGEAFLEPMFESHLAGPIVRKCVSSLAEAQ